MLARWLDERDAGRTNLYVLDIRQVAEYRAGHLPGAIALPGGLAVQRTDEFLPVRAAQVVLVDDDEARAALAGYWLRAMGLPAWPSWRAGCRPGTPPDTPWATACRPCRRDGGTAVPGARRARSGRAHAARLRRYAGPLSRRPPRRGRMGAVRRPGSVARRPRQTAGRARRRAHGARRVSVGQVRRAECPAGRLRRGRAGRWRNSLAGARLAAGERAWRRRRASRRRRRATV